MWFAWDIFHYLECVCNANFDRDRFFEESIVKSLSVSYPVTVMAENDSGHEEEVYLLGFDWGEMLVGLKDVEFPFLRLGQFLDCVKLQGFAFHPGQHECFI